MKVRLWKRRWELCRFVSLAAVCFALGTGSTAQAQCLISEQDTDTTNCTCFPDESYILTGETLQFLDDDKKEVTFIDTNCANGTCGTVVIGTVDQILPQEIQQEPTCERNRYPALRAGYRHDHFIVTVNGCSVEPNQAYVDQNNHANETSFVVRISAGPKAKPGDICELDIIQVVMSVSCTQCRVAVEFVLTSTIITSDEGVPMVRASEKTHIRSGIKSFCFIARAYPGANGEKP